MSATERPIPVDVRAQLLAIGVPAHKHVPQALEEMFPPELNIANAALNAEDLARVLVHFAERGLISTNHLGPRTSIRNVEPGWHSCLFYRDWRQLLQLTAPYIAEGLANGEGCLWVVPQAVAPKTACDAIARVVGDARPYLDSGQLEVLTHPNWYLDASGRLKTFEQIGAALLDRQDRALAKGFKFLRAAGDTGWISGSQESMDFIDYEVKINEALKPTKVAAVCTYRVDVTADELVAIVSAHQDALYTAPSM